MIMDLQLRAPRTIERYLGRSFLINFLILLISVTVILQILDLLTTSEDILSPPGATYMSILHYIQLRFPQLLAQFVPFTALLAAILTYSTLNQHSEITVMKAAGLSAYQIIAPLVMVSMAIAFCHFIFNETVVTSSTAELRHWEANNFALDVPPAPEGAAQTWVLDGNNLIEAASVSRNGLMLVIDNVAIYERNPEGQLTGITKADFGLYQDNRWTLFRVRHFNMGNNEVTSSPQMDWNSSIPPERFLALAVVPEQVSFGKLLSAMVRLDEEGYSTRALSASLYHKLAAPAATLLMPLLAALAAFGVVRSGMMFIRIAIAMAFGFSYFIVDNLLLAMGQFGRMPPMIAAWAPFLLFLAAGLMVVVYTED
ncbi:LPS export ABC transporter permease LptG [Govanella unica]|uniref:LPS export ABC transporter permease LptG n=1 Tax=Govanella unica TaxID=2975056 RepID=A0A9X3TXR7_9PROT|nr:LPS export ABC transporter permease LptG [Govania unica]MDA5193645.1 LPS export ABC transporter permease LptG [Govania unica]